MLRATLAAFFGVTALAGASVPGASPYVPDACLVHNLIDGTAQADTVTATPRSDLVFAFDGNDHVDGGAGDDCLFGGDGANTLRGGPGNDVLAGRSDAGAAFADYLVGGPGADSLYGWDGNDRLSGGSGADRIEGGMGDDLISGGPGNDAIGGGQGHNVIRTGSGDDRISSANDVSEVVDCGPGRDLVRADRSDRLIGCERVRRLAVPRWPHARPLRGSPATRFTVGVASPSDGRYDVVLDRVCASTPHSPWDQHGVGPAFEFPPPPGGGWCPGRYTGEITLLSTPGVTPGPVACDPTADPRCLPVHGIPCATVADWQFQVTQGSQRPLWSGEASCRTTTAVGKFGFTVRGPARPQRACQLAGATTRAESSQGRVVEVQLGDETFTFVCLYKARRFVKLLSTNYNRDGSTGVGLFRFAGPFLAFQGWSEGAAGGVGYGLAVVDGRTGRRVHGVALPLAGQASAIVLSPRGSVAWIESEYDERGQIAWTRVAKIDGMGYAVLDERDGIDRKALTLTGSAVHWVTAGVAQTAELN
jgi:Ca2+-binding RTX toxin-like protein